MSTVDRLRPEPGPLDPAWAEDELDRITRTPQRRLHARRRTGLVVAGVVTAALAGGGVAVAAGWTPPWVDRQVRELSAANGGRWDGVRMVEIAAFRTPSGHQFAVWGGTRADGARCLAGAVDARGEELSPRSFVACGPPGGLALNTFVHDQGTIAYGVSPVPTATSVELRHGGEVLGVLAVDPDTHGWGGGLPRAREVDRLEAAYTDARGEVVATETLVAP